jgi:hypothetical protein
MTLARTSAFKFFAVACSGLGFLAFAGCGDDTGLAKRYAVSGTVKYNDKPVEKGRIDFIPADLKEGRAAGGSISNGYYTLTTATDGDGALPGSYNVTVSSIELDTSAGAGAPGGGQAFRQSKASVKVEKEAKYHVPQKYARVDTSKLTAKVEAHSNKFDFDLTD